MIIKNWFTEVDNISENTVNIINEGFKKEWPGYEEEDLATIGDISLLIRKILTWFKY